MKEKKDNFLEKFVPLVLFVKTVDLVILTEEIHNGKLHFL